jgi:hypothetical protein
MHVYLRTAIIALAVVIAPLIVKADNTLPNWLPNCEGVPQKHPASMLFACGDGSIGVDHIKWQNWGTTAAHGIGVLSENDCTPDCADGHFHSFKAAVTAYGKQVCPHGDIAYKRVKYTILDPNLPRSQVRSGDSPFPCNPL